MDSIRVQGGAPLQGKVRIQGSKNAALPILAACIMMKEKCRLDHVPKISDVYGMLQILEGLGCRTQWNGHSLTVDPSGFHGKDVAGEAAKSMRSSIFLLGAMLARQGRATLENPGGCVIGKRPIDLHVKSLKAMGVTFRDRENGILARTGKGLCPAEIWLDFPSVGATENVIMAATAAKGETRIHGAAREPEVTALCGFLNAAGAGIRGMGTGELCIRGGMPLHGVRFRIPSDRIVAGTYLFCGFSAGGNVLLEDAPSDQMEAILLLAERMGAGITVTREGIYAQFPERAGMLSSVRTDVYPGFPTDLQSALLAVRCTGTGKCLVRESIFENRFRIAGELQKMGAKIRQTDEKCVLVEGVRRLRGCKVEACELRGGAALVAAALGAEGETVISGKRYVDRGYENICKDLRELGARIVGE